MKRVLVFCGSSPGNHPAYVKIAYELGASLASKNIELVYGGAQIGLMGAVANGVLDNGGKVIGVIPKFLNQKEVVHTGLTELFTVETMHERKAKMMILAHSIIALPGGYGTLEELFEAMTWSQLELHRKPIGILNINGYYNYLNNQINTMVEAGFLKKTTQQNLHIEENIETLLSMLQQHI